MTIPTGSTDSGSVGQDLQDLLLRPQPFETVVHVERDKRGAVRKEHLGQVSSAALARIRELGGTLSYNPTVSRGYPYIAFHGWRRSVHLFVSEFYNGPVPDGHDVHHINRDTLDNRIENLEAIDARTHRTAHLHANELTRRKSSPRRRHNVGLGFHRPRPSSAVRQVNPLDLNYAPPVARPVSIKRQLFDDLMIALSEVLTDTPSSELRETFKARQIPEEWDDVACRRSGIKALTRKLNNAEKGLLLLLKFYNWEVNRIAAHELPGGTLEDISDADLGGLLAEILARPHVAHALSEFRKTGVVPIYTNLKPPPPPAQTHTTPRGPSQPKTKNIAPRERAKQITFAPDTSLSEEEAFEIQRDFVQVEEIVGKVSDLPVAPLLDSDASLPVQDPGADIRVRRLRQRARNHGTDVMTLLCASAAVLGSKAVELSRVPHVRFVSPEMANK